MTYGLTFDVPGSPALVLEGDLHPGWREGEATEGAFVVVAVAESGPLRGRAKPGDRVFLIALPDARRVP